MVGKAFIQQKYATFFSIYDILYSWEAILQMNASLLAIDYSRPVLALFKQPKQTAVVHSIFHRAVNIIVGNAMLTLLSSDLPRMPNSVRLAPDALARLSQSLKPGTIIWLGDGKLLTPAQHTLHLPDITPWESRPTIRADQWDRQIVAWHANILTHMLIEYDQCAGLASLARPLLLGQPIHDTPLTQMALPALHKLMQATRQQDSQGIEESVRRLSGLGPGLTPAGDDVLGGFTSVMALLGCQIGNPMLPYHMIATIIARTARSCTNLLSATLLLHAAQGEVAEQLGKLLLALTLPKEATKIVRQRAEHLLATGATSGSDTLLGVLLGLKALEERIGNDIHSE